MTAVILRGWKSVDNGWRGKWLRKGTGSTMTHCTLTIGELTLHVNYQGSESNWYPTHRLFYTYKDSFKPVKQIFLNSVQRPIYIKPDLGSTWSVIRWKYLFGPRPSCCSTACIDALRQNGFDCPELIQPHKLIEHYDNLRIKRESKVRKVYSM